MDKTTKGQLEAKISEAIIKFEKEFMGRGPLEANTFIVKDAILIRCKGLHHLSQEEAEVCLHHHRVPAVQVVVE